VNNSESFASLGLSKWLIKSVADQGYDRPTLIQIKSIPAILAGKDLLASAQTGTGKTAAFVLPVLQKLSKGRAVQVNRVRALILAPTRELALQINEQVQVLGQGLELRSQVVFGGVKINPQMMSLRKGVDVLVATPGRLLDLYRQNAVKFTQLEIVVFDEADKMIDMGFIDEVSGISELLPSNRQSLMYTATFSESVRSLARTLVKNPVEISLTPDEVAAETITQIVHPVDKKKKSALLNFLIRENDWQQVLVFCETKQGADRLTRYLNEKKIKSSAMHGNKSQAARLQALADFKAGEIRCLIATDLAARGLDIDLLPRVVNFNLPHVATDYVHRIGRTGRAGSDGLALSLVCADEFKELSAIERLLKQLLPRQVIAAYSPVNQLPPSQLDLRPIKPKKPKKPKKPNKNHKDEKKT